MKNINLITGSFHVILKITGKIHPLGKIPHMWIQAVTRFINQSLAKVTKLGNFAGEE